MKLCGEIASPMTTSLEKYVQNKDGYLSVPLPDSMHVYSTREDKHLLINKVLWNRWLKAPT